MIGRDRCLSLLQELLAASPADQTELSLTAENLAPTRFANSAITQNMAIQTLDFKVRVVVGRRKGGAVAHDLRPESLRKALDRAVETARLGTEMSFDYRFPAPTNPVPEVATWDEETAVCGPAERAAGVAAVVETMRPRGVDAFGSLITTNLERSVVNSSGLAVYVPLTEAHLILTGMREGAAGYAADHSRRIASLPLESVAVEAAERCLAARGARAVEPGTYDVILLPYAASELLSFMGPLFFSALAVAEERSYVAGRLGERFGPENLTLYDDGADPAGMPTPCDLEGVGKRRVEIVRQGVLNALVFDSATAQRAGAENTGHAFPPNNNGLLPDPHTANLFVAAGDSTVEEMIASTERGVLATRLHYTRCVDARGGVVSGTTREGTFLVENGRVACPIYNLRFVEAIIPALGRAEMIGRERRTEWQIAHGPASLSKGLGAITTPALKIKDFRFTGVTEF